MKTLLLIASIVLSAIAGYAFYFMNNNLIGVIVFAVAVACFMFYRKQNENK